MNIPLIIIGAGGMALALFYLAELLDANPRGRRHP